MSQGLSVSIILVSTRRCSRVLSAWCSRVHLSCRGRAGCYPDPPSAPRCRTCRERGPWGCSLPPSSPAWSVTALLHPLAPPCVRLLPPRFIRVDDGRPHRLPSPLSSFLSAVPLPSLMRPLAALAGVRWSPPCRGGLGVRPPCVVSAMAVG